MDRVFCLMSTMHRRLTLAFVENQSKPSQASERLSANRSTEDPFLCFFHHRAELDGINGAASKSCRYLGLLPHLFVLYEHDLPELVEWGAEDPDSSF